MLHPTNNWTFVQFLGRGCTTVRSVAAGQTQTLILDAVQSVIVRDGVRGASMRQVADQAGVSLGLLSYYFDGKDSLILAAFDRATNRLLDASIEAASKVDDPVEQMKQFLRGSFTNDFLDGDYLRLRVSLWAVALTDPAIAQLDAEYFERYSAQLRLLIQTARPDLSATELNGRTTDVIAASNGVWLNWARFANRDDLERGLLRCEAIALDDTPLP